MAKNLSGMRLAGLGLDLPGSRRRIPLSLGHPAILVVIAPLARCPVVVHARASWRDSASSSSSQHSGAPISASCSPKLARSISAAISMHGSQHEPSVIVPPQGDSNGHSHRSQIPTDGISTVSRHGAETGSLCAQHVVGMVLPWRCCGVKSSSRPLIAQVDECSSEGSDVL